jgi:hypothetical protein
LGLKQARRSFRFARGLLPHVGAPLIFGLAAAVSMRGWFVEDRVPGGDFAGYAAVTQYVRDMLLEHGANVDFVEFHGDHTIPPQAVQKTSELLHDMLSDLHRT